MLTKEMIVDCVKISKLIHEKNLSEADIMGKSSVVLTGSGIEL
jgi:hypothetical protein